MISDAISSVNAALASAGIQFDANTTPYFESSSLSAGVSVDLSATIQMAATQVLELVTDFFQSTTSPEDEDPNFSKLGVGTSSDSSSPVSIDLDQLLSETVLSAGFDVTFGLELNLNEIQSIVTAGTAVDAALNSGVALKIDSWGAFASLIVDPIALDISLFGQTIAIHDSHLAMSVELRSRGPFSASLESLVDGTANTTALIPDLVVPFSSEIVLDVPVYEGLVISPIMKLESTNLIDDFALDFDVDLSAFLDTDLLGSFTLDKVIQNATDLLDAIMNLGPMLNAGGTAPSALDGLFDIVGEVQDLGDALTTYKDLVGQGTPKLVCFSCCSVSWHCVHLTRLFFIVQSLVAPEIRSVVKHASHLARNGCADPSESFAIYAFDRLNGVLPSGLLIEDFSPCDYLAQLQQVLFSTSSLNDDVTYETFVILPASLKTELQGYYTGLEDLNGEFVSLFCHFEMLYLHYH